MTLIIAGTAKPKNTAAYATRRPGALVRSTIQAINAPRQVPATVLPRANTRVSQMRRGRFGEAKMASYARSEIPPVRASALPGDRLVQAMKNSGGKTR